MRLRTATTITIDIDGAGAGLNSGRSMCSGDTIWRSRRTRETRCCRVELDEAVECLELLMGDAVWELVIDLLSNDCVSLS